MPPRVVAKILGRANASITLAVCAFAALDMQMQALGIMDEVVTPIAVVLPRPVATNRNHE
jgi:hypothetical protein